MDQASAIGGGGGLDAGQKFSVADARGNTKFAHEGGAALLKSSPDTVASKLGIVSAPRPIRSSSAMKSYCMPVSLTVTIGTGEPRPTKPRPAPRNTTCTFCASTLGA